MAAAAKRRREDGQAITFPAGPAAIAAGTVVSLWLCAILAVSSVAAVINAAGGTLEANVWPNGPTGVAFSDAECAELHRLLSLFYDAPGWPYRVARDSDGFVRVEWHQFRSWLVGQPLGSELHEAWAAINELLRSKLLAAGILGLFYLACWRVVFRLGDHNPDHQDAEADSDLYGAGGRRCLLSCNAKDQRGGAEAEARPVRLDSSGAGPNDLRHCYMCETRDSAIWYYWPPKGGPNPGQPPHHRACDVCRASLYNGSLVKEQHRASRCGLHYQCPDGACGPNGC